MAGKVGFAPASHGMTLDATEIYWSETAVDPYPDAAIGAFCYVDRGARRVRGAWPSDESDPFAGPVCDSGVS